MVDACVVGAIALFGWAGGLLGGAASIARTICAFLAFAVAVLLCDPAGVFVAALTGLGKETSRIIGASLTGAITWIAMAALVRWWQARRRAARVDPEWEYEADDPLDRTGIARVAGALFGLGWAILFTSMLVMLPGDNIVSRAAVASNSGGLLIRQEGILRWLDARFPHYTQTLPKGAEGAVVGNAGSLPMRGTTVADAVPADADVLLGSVNAKRRAADRDTLEPNRAVAAVAQRHAEALAEDHELSTRASGVRLDGQVRAALGSDADSFGARPTVLVVWAHTPGNAISGLTVHAASRASLISPRFVAIGIGAADAGWFNGRIYVLVLIQRRADSTDTTDTTDTTGAATSPGDGQPLTVDSDGDGDPDLTESEAQQLGVIASSD